MNCLLSGEVSKHQLSSFALAHNSLLRSVIFHFPLTMLFFVFQKCRFYYYYYYAFFLVFVFEFALVNRFLLTSLNVTWCIYFFHLTFYCCVIGWVTNQSWTWLQWLTQLHFLLQILVFPFYHWLICRFISHKRCWVGLQFFLVLSSYRVVIKLFQIIFGVLGRNAFIWEDWWSLYEKENDAQNGHTFKRKPRSIRETRE